MVNSLIAPDELVLRVSRAHTRVLELVDRLDDAQKDAASALPGWSRGHVLKHLADNARAFDRQARAALRGEVVDMYDGGRAERDRSIDRGAARPVVELWEELRLTQRALEGTWNRLTAVDWRREVRFRHATVLDTALARWREAEIHAVDLKAGHRPPRLVGGLRPARSGLPVGACPGRHPAGLALHGRGVHPSPGKGDDGRGLRSGA